MYFRLVTKSTKFISKLFSNRKMCKENGIVNDYMWTGITRKTGSWKHADGRSLKGFQFDWTSGTPYSTNGRDFMGISCYEDYHFGKIINKPKRFSRKFVCQN